MSEPVRELIGGRYQILTTLGRGGMGVVYKAHDPVLEREVAIKKMSASVVDSDEGRRRFQVEARAAARLNHPNIVTIFELEEYRGDVYIVMELLEGLSLATLLERRAPLPVEAQLTILAQVCDGLDFAHTRAIIHRDVKPANLLLLTSGIVKILDFGIARLAASDLTRQGSVLGTPNYMAPEQVSGEPLDARADLFSVGAVAYEMASGVKAFSADSVPSLLMKIAEASYRPIAEVAPQTPPALASLITRLLSKSPDQRPPRGADVRDALDDIGAIDRLDIVGDLVVSALSPDENDTIVQRTGHDRHTTPIASRPIISTHRGTLRGGPTPVQPPSVSASAALPKGAAPEQPPSTDDLGPTSLGPAAPPLPPPSVAIDPVPPPVPPSLPSGLAPPVAPMIAPSIAPPVAPSVAPTLLPGAVAAGMPAPPPPPLVVPPVAAAAAVAASAAVPAAASTLPTVAPGSAQPLLGLQGGNAANGGNATPGNAPGSAKATNPSAAATIGAVPTARRTGIGTALFAIGLVLVLAAITVVASWMWWQRLREEARSAVTTLSTSVTDRDAKTTPSATTPAANTSLTPGSSTTTPADSKPTDATTTPPSSEATPSEATPSETMPSESRPAETTPGVAESAPGAPADPPSGTVADPSKPVVEAPGSTRSTPPPVAVPSTPPTRPNDVPTRGRTRPAAAPLESGPVKPESGPVKFADREPAPPVDSAPPPPPPADAPRNTGPKPASPPDTPPVDRAPADPPAPEAPRRGRTSSPRTEVDSETVSAFQRTGNATAQIGGDQTMTAAAMVRIKEILERYGRAIAERDADALHGLRESITPAEQKLLDGPAVTVHFADLDINVDATRATARARRTIAVSGRPASTDTVDVQLIRRPSGWVITSFSR